MRIMKLSKREQVLQIRAPKHCAQGSIFKRDFKYGKNTAAAKYDLPAY